MAAVDVGNYAMGCYDGSTATLHGGVFIARGGINNYALSNEFNVTMKADNVTALAENGSNSNHGLWNVNNAKLVLHGASLTGRGGTNAYGIYSANDGTMLEAESVTALGKDGTNENYGLYNSGQYSSDIVTTTLRNSSFTGDSGTDAYGIYITGTLTTLAGESITALGKDGSSTNYGLYNKGGAEVRLSGGAFTGRGGTDARGISNDSSSKLFAASVTALGENGSSESEGLVNTGVAALRGGTFTGRGGITAFGIGNLDIDTTLEAESVTALAENGGTLNFGLHNYITATATLRGGSFTGRGGTEARGIANDSGSKLIAESVSALGENGDSESEGLFNAGAAVLSGGAFTGREGTNAIGIYNADGSNITLAAERVTALGKDGSSTNYGLRNDNNATTTANSSQFIGRSDGLYQTSGTVHLGVSQLDGDATLTGGTLTCFQVYDGNYAYYTCPIGGAG